MILLVLVTLALAGLFAWNARIAGQIAADNPPQGQFVALPGGRLHIVTRAPTGAPRATVVLLHGASGNQADLMEALAMPLAARGFRVIGVDRPGHGWSDRLPGTDQIAGQASAIRAALESIGVREAIVVGHSWSGALAENLLLDHAGFATGAVLLAPVTHPWPGGISWYYRLATLPVLGAAFMSLVAPVAGAATIEQGVASVFAPQKPPADYVARTGAALVLRPAEFAANAQDVSGLKAFVTAQVPREGDIRQPVAIIAGDRDSVVSTHIHSQPSARTIPDVTLKILPGVGHSVHWADPEAVVSAVEDVMRRIETRTPAQSRAARPETSASAPSTSSQ